MYGLGENRRRLFAVKIQSNGVIHSRMDGFENAFYYELARID